MFNTGLNLWSSVLRNKSGGSSPGFEFLESLSSILYYRDYLGFGRLFQDAAGTVGVIAVDEPVGHVKDYSTFDVALSHPATQSTSSKRPLLKLDTSGRYMLKYDRIDDFLTLSDVPSGVYTVGTASWYGAQVYPITLLSTGTLNLNPADSNAVVLLTGTLTTQEKSDLLDWLNDRRETTGVSDVLRFSVGSSSVNLAVVESSSSGASWVLGDGQTATGNSCVKTIVAPKTAILRATTPQNITELNWTSKGLFGQVDLTKLTGLTKLYLSSNAFSGALDISALTALILLYVQNNFFGGYLNVSTNTALTIIQIDNNWFTGNVNVSPCTSLTSFSGSNNKFSSFSGTVPATLGSFVAQSNIFPQAEIDKILAAFVTAGRSSGTRILTLNGAGNAAPSSSGLASKATLESRGWTVTHN